MNVLYETRLLNPNGEERVYVGIHSLDRGPLWSEDCRTGYIGSGGVFNKSKKLAGYEKTLKSGWRVLSVIELKQNATLQDESFLIKKYQTLFGVAPECGKLVTDKFTLGICVNVSSGSDNLTSLEIRKKAADARTEYYRTDAGRKDLRSRSERNSSENRSRVMRNNPDLVAKFVKAGHSEDARRKRHESYVASGNAKRVSYLGNAVLMSRGRKCILQDGFVGISSEIVSHTGLVKGSVGAKMSEAFKKGESRCRGWIFKPVK